MLCFLCGNEISWLRSMVDRQYCCAEHRNEARLASAHVMREEEDDQDELWSVSRNRAKQGTRKQASSNQASIVAFATLGALIVAMLMLPGNGSNSGGGGQSLSLAPGAKQGMMAKASGAIGDLVRKSSPVTLRHDFRTGLKEWTTVAMNGTPQVDDPHDWKTPSAPTQILPGTLRIWEPSKSMQNYQMEFQGEIEKKSLSWAFRASDQKNFYAAKLVITRPGPQPNAGLVHYVMMNGQELDKVQLPLPVTLARGENYRVMVSVQDDRFVTYLNGQVISSWTDNHLQRGGVGFFSDNDDQQKVAWVNVSERDSFVGKMLSHFGLFVVPGSPLPGTPLR